MLNQMPPAETGSCGSDPLLWLPGVSPGDFALPEPRKPAERTRGSRGPELRADDRALTAESVSRRQGSNNRSREQRAECRGRDPTVLAPRQGLDGISRTQGKGREAQVHAKRAIIRRLCHCLTPHLPIEYTATHKARCGGLTQSPPHRAQGSSSYLLSLSATWCSLMQLSDQRSASMTRTPSSTGRYGSGSTPACST